jgi:hypothetical protein
MREAPTSFPASPANFRSKFLRGIKNALIKVGTRKRGRPISHELCVFFLTNRSTDIMSFLRPCAISAPLGLHLNGSPRIQRPGEPLMYHFYLELHLCLRPDRRTPASSCAVDLAHRHSAPHFQAVAHPATVRNDSGERGINFV